MPQITPHLVVETVQSMGAGDPYWRTAKALPGVLALLNQAVLFRFGAMHPSQEHKDFALDLNERALFSLPFPVTAFSFEGAPHPSQHIKGTRAAGAMMVVHQDEKRALSAIMCAEARDPDGGFVGAIPIGIIMRAKLANAKDGSVDVSEETYPLMSDRIMAMMYGDAGERGYGLMRQRLCSNLVGCLGMAVMLMSKGVETELEPAPSRLNAAREKKGKPRINSSYTVRVSVGDMRTIALEGGDESISGHTRGAPRLHWRRGHFRTLWRGSENERVVPVAPSLVGANDSAAPIRAKAYEVRR